MPLFNWREIGVLAIMVLWGLWVRGLWVREQSGTIRQPGSRRDRAVLWAAAIASAVVIVFVAGDLTAIALRLAILALVIASLFGLGQGRKM